MERLPGPFTSPSHGLSCPSSQGWTGREIYNQRQYRVLCTPGQIPLWAPVSWSFTSIWLWFPVSLQFSVRNPSPPTLIDIIDFPSAPSWETWSTAPRLVAAGCASLGFPQQTSPWFLLQALSPWEKPSHGWNLEGGGPDEESRQSFILHDPLSTRDLYNWKSQNTPFPSKIPKAWILYKKWCFSNTSQLGHRVSSCFIPSSQPRRGK